MSIGDMIVAAQSGGGSGGQSQPGGYNNGTQAAAGPTTPSAMNMAQPQVYGPDQSIGASIQALMQMHENDRRANAIDRGLAGMASSFGPVEDRASIRNSAQPQNDSIGALGGAINDTSGMMQLAQHQQMMNLLGGGGGAPAGGAPAAGAAPGGAPSGGPPGAGPPGAGGGPVAGAVGAPAPGGGGQSLSDMSGIPPSVLQTMYLSNPATFGEELNKAIQLHQGVPAQQAAQVEQAKDAEAQKNAGVEGFTASHQKLLDSEAGVNQLLGNMDATMTALSAPDILTTSKWAANLPIGYSDAVKQQAVQIQKLEAGLTGESLQSVKNVRNQREFGTLGEALTAGLNANNGKQGVQQALLDIQRKMAATHANVYATAGKQIPNQYAGMADPSYTSPTINGTRNPYFTGATYEPPQQTAQGPPATIQSPGDIAKLARGAPFTIPSGPNAGKVGYAQ